MILVIWKNTSVLTELTLMKQEWRTYLNISEIKSISNIQLKEGLSLIEI